MTALSPNDPNSYSNPESVLVSHIHIDLDIDFNNHVLSGTVMLKLDKVQQTADTLILDTSNLKIHSVTDLTSGQSLSYTLGEPIDTFGSKLEIKLPQENGEAITIKYETSPDCSALQWLRPEQTAGKRHPYMFSQCQAIHCRSLVPCQDTPSVKCPYTAQISAPRELTVLMSALFENADLCPRNDSRKIYTFRQNTPMPSYLIAIVAGDLVSRDIGPRSKVWSEKEYVDKAAYEFAETEQMLKIAEELMGPYVWGQYDLLVLPPSFPYGGMENPCLTFVTPTLLAGDRTLADVVAHEIAHSWTGNLVTNKTFQDFWLNEGNTMFFERKIAARLNQGEPFRQLLAISGWNVLVEAVEVLGKEHPYTRLCPDMRGVDPDDAFSQIPYEKGHALLFYLESLVGGPSEFEPFLRAYINKFKYQSIDSKDWKDYLYSYFEKKGKAGVFDVVDWDGWFTGLGLPPVKPKYDTTLLDACTALGQRWVDAPDDGLGQFTKEDIASFHTVQTTEFLSTFLTKDPLSSAKIKALGEVYKLNKTHNSEVQFKWLRVCIRARAVDVIPEALKFVTEQGRMKFILPIYRDLFDWEESKSYAISNFETNKHQMHSTSVMKVQKLLEKALQE